MNTKSRIFALTIAALLLSSIGTITILTANAHNPPQNIPTYAFINIAPSPAGVGQTVTVGFWLGMPPPTANGPYGDRWQGMTVVVKKPDGTSETLGPFKSDDTGGTYTTYTPQVTGTYTFQMFFPGQTLAGDYLTPGTTSPFIGDYYEPSNSSIFELKVQQEPIPTLPQNPLPSEYWTRPIQSTNGYWHTISGNWLGLGQQFSAATGQYNATSNYNPYTLAPQTAHIVWSKPYAPGGLVGGEFGGSSTSNFYSTSQYEPKFAPIIMNGVLYYTQFPGASSNPTGWVAIDLHTGQTLWTYNTTTQILRCGQLLDYVSPNQYGSFAYLWSTGNIPGVPIKAGSTTYNMYDAMTGNYILSIVNGSAMTITEDEQGNLIGYYASGGNLTCWNSTQCIIAETNGPAAWMWRPRQGGILNFNSGIMWTEPLATNISGVPLPGSLSIAATGPVTQASCINSGVVIMTAGGSAGGLFQPGSQIEAGYSSIDGSQLWIVNRTYTPYSRVVTEAIGNGVYVMASYEDTTLYGYDANTGKALWKDVLSDANPYDSIGGFQNDIANGTMYIWGFGGDIWSIDLHTGNINWETNTTVISGDPGTNTPYGVWPIWTFPKGTIADGLLFLGEGHEYSPPLFGGAQQLAINITNGKPVWNILAFDVCNSMAISDGVGIVANAYDNQIYAYSQGPTKLTVTAPSAGVTTDQTITITGTITDISAGASQQAVAANYPNGLPCVSDDSMTPFMESVYMQQQMPANITGVPITLNVIDANGNYRTIGTATSTAYGTFSYNWTPDIPGAYTIIASFGGSKSYYPSTASSAFYANEPAPTGTPVTQTQQAPIETYLAISTVAIIAAIIIIGAILIVTVKKRSI